MTTPPTLSLKKSLTLLKAIVFDGGARPVSALAADLGLPLSTAYRFAVTLEQTGFVMRLRRGHYLAGPLLAKLAVSRGLDEILVSAGRAIVADLAKRTGCTAHLGILEAEMVAYLLKSGSRDDSLFTREGMQLEAYCTAIGKALLATLHEEDRERYLAGGPFIRLTPSTLVSSEDLRQELARAQTQGYAVDNSEMDTNLVCLAVPVRDPDGDALAAISISIRQSEGQRSDPITHLPSVASAARDLERKLYPSTLESKPGRSAPQYLSPKPRAAHREQHWPSLRERPRQPLLRGSKCHV